METMGDRLRKLREAKGWTLEEAARELKTNMTYLNAIECNRGKNREKR